MTRTPSCLWVTLFTLALVPALLPAQDKPTPIPGLTDRLGLDAPPRDLLGPVYEDMMAGIAFRPPVSMKLTAKADPDRKGKIAEFLDEKNQWLLKVTQVALGSPMNLHSTGEGKSRQVGLLEFTINEMKTEHPAAEIRRNEIINVGEYGVGVAIFRFSIGTQRFLRQQAIVQAHDQLYYIFNLTSPAAKTGKPEDDPGEVLAASTFKQLLDSIAVLDRTAIRKDQVERLFRTRALFVDWNHQGGKRLKDAMIPEQWLRIIKDGKDIGYSYVVEEFVDGGNARANPNRAYDGVLISVRTRSIENNTQVDLGAQMYTAFDRKHEDWASIVNVVKNKGAPNAEKQQSSEFGFSELRRTRRLDPDVVRDDKDKNAPIKEIETYRLTCVRPRKEKGADALVKPDTATAVPSPWYIPQAVGSMLPRLLPLNKPVTYMFQVFVSDQKSVVHRYVDVGFEKQVNFEGREIRVIPITDRIRLEGSPTIHYMSPEGKYLGSVNEDSRVTILPTDAQTLQKIWGDPNLTKQEEIERPK